MSDSNDKKRGVYSGAAAIESARRKYAAKQKFPLLFGLLYRERTADGKRWRIRPNWKNISIFGVLGVLSIWLMGSVVVYCGYRYFRDYKEISFLQVVKAPWAREELTAALGEYNIAHAKKMFETGNYGEGYMNLSQGVVRSPDNLSARLELAAIKFMWFKDVDASSDILYPKLKKAFLEKNEPYLSMSLSMFFNSDKYREDAYKLLKGASVSKVMSLDALRKSITSMVQIAMMKGNNLLCAQICEKGATIVSSSDAEFSRFLAASSAASYLVIKEYAKAGSVLKEHGVSRGDIYLRVLAEEKWNTKQEDKAVSIMEAVARRTKEKSSTYSILSRYYSELDCPNSAKSADRTAMLLGEIYNSVIYSIEEKLDLGDESSALVASKKFLKENGSDEKAVRKLMEVAIEKNSENLVKEILASENVSSQMKDSLGELNVAFLLKTGNPRDAATELERLRYSRGSSANNKSLSKYEIAIVAKNGDADSARVQIEQFFTRYKSDVGELSSLVKFFRLVGLTTQSRFLCERAIQENPDSASLAYLRVEIATDEGDVQTILDLSQKYKMRWPLAAMKLIWNTPNSDALLFVSREKYGDALRDFAEMKQRIEDYKRTKMRD